MTLMTGQLVQLRRIFHGLPVGTVGVVTGSSEAGWLVVFGCVSITLKFADKGGLYDFV